MKVERDADGEKSYTIEADSRKKKPESPADSIHHLYGRDRHLLVFRFDFGVNTFVNNQTNATGGVPALSHFFTSDANYYNVGLDYVQPLLYSKHSRLALTFGPEFMFNSFKLRGSNVWVEKDGRTTAVQAPDAMQVDQARLFSSSINLPMMVELKLLNSRNHRTLTVGAGGFGGYRLYSSTRVDYRMAGSDYDHQDVVSGPFHLNDWQYGLQGELGYGFFRIVGQYHLNELFEDNKGPRTQVMSVGLKLLGF